MIMRKIEFSFYFFALSFTLSACSKVNSIQPFDNEQAAILLQQQSIAKPSEQRIAMTLPQKPVWQRITIADDSHGTALMLLPKQQNKSNWNERIQTKIRGYRSAPSITLSSFLHSEIVSAKENCEHVSTHFLSNNTAYILYQMKLSGCKHQADEDQIGKIFKGSDALYAVQYSAKTGTISYHTFQRISASIKTAHLVSNPFHSQRKK